MRSIDDYLEEARARFARVSPEDLEEAMSAGALVVDIRPEANRRQEGELPGAVIIERNVLEWRLAPSSDARSIEVEPGRSVIVVCNEGYQSSLAAATLIDLGVDGATDLIGGFRAWKSRPRSD